MTYRRAVDRLEEDLGRLEWGLTKECANEYCDMIKRKAKEMCALEEDDLNLKPIVVEGNVNLDFSLKDRGKVNCVACALEGIIPLIPVTGRKVFEDLLHRLYKSQ